MNDIENAQKRFWRMVDPDGDAVIGMGQKCWRWIGAFDEKGRPRFKFQGKSMKANRAMLVLDGLELTPDDCVIAICQQRGCVNPAHHVVGTLEEAENVADSQLEPLRQSLLRGAFNAKKITLDQIVECFGISVPIAKAILREEIDLAERPPDPAQPD